MIQLRVKKKIKEENQITLLGGWWDKKSKNEIDLIAVNEIEKKCLIYEIKRNAKGKLMDKRILLCVVLLLLIVSSI